MRPSKLAAVALLLAACDTGPTAVDRRRTVAGPASEVVTDVLYGAPSLTVSAPGQLVTLDRDGSSERAWFQAQIIVSDDGKAQADGAILVVSAADGPMPQTQRDAESLSIDIQNASVDPDGVIYFEGNATLRDAGGERTFDTAGSVRPQAAPTPPPDTMIWDIIGGPPYAAVRFSARTLIRSP